MVKAADMIYQDRARPRRLGCLRTQIDRKKMFDFVRGIWCRLDIGVESAYTTEFLDGSEKPAEGPRYCGQDEGHATEGHVEEI